MKSSNDIAVGQSVMSSAAEAILRCSDQIGEAFSLAVQLIFDCPGRTITCGVGKSGHIARKIAGTLSSTGTPSLFLHAAEAVHGDLGMITAGDVVLMYSHSGETDELVRLFPSIRAIGAKTILVTGREVSSAARLADVVLPTYVVDEACPNNLAPTTSTTVMLALSDALAVAVMSRRGFSKEDFARFHPAGALGKRLLLRVEDVMRRLSENALVKPEAQVLDVIRAMTEAGAGAALVIGAEEELLGLISEGNLRRHLLASQDALSGSARDMMNAKPLTIEANLLAIDALEVFQNFPVKIGEIPVVDGQRLVGLLVLKDLLRTGIV